jgi:hypothetical protein
MLELVPVSDSYLPIYPFRISIGTAFRLMDVPSAFLYGAVAELIWLAGGWCCCPGVAAVWRGERGLGGLVLRAVLGAGGWSASWSGR